MENVLDDVPENKYFYVANGMIMRNLNDMCAVLDIIDKNVFEKHANKSKNDFANWIKHVYKDDKLALAVSKANNKKAMLRIVKGYIKEYETEELFLEILGFRIEKFTAGLVIGCLFGVSLGLFLFAFLF